MNDRNGSQFFFVACMESVAESDGLNRPCIHMGHDIIGIGK